MELARLAVDSGGDPGAIQRALDPTMLPVPYVEASQENRCELTRTPYGRRFANEFGQFVDMFYPVCVINRRSVRAYVFELIVARGPSVGLNVSLSRYDLFHGQLFLASKTGRLGILRFHAKEYPAFDKVLFPNSLGYCQAAPLPSNGTRTWLAPGVLAVLDAHPGGIIYQDMIPDYIQVVRTVYEAGLTISLAVSFSISCCATPSSPSSHTSASSRSPAPSPQAVAAVLLSILAGPRAAAQVPAAEATRLRACLRFLSPVNPAVSKVSSWSGGGYRKFLLEGRDAGAAEADEMVMWPPAPVMDLARLAVDSGGDPGAVHRALDPTMLPVPDVEGSQKNKCQLTRTPFHAKEYPAFDKELFPYSLGYCQAGSNVPYDDSMNLRNILWLAPLPSKETKAWLAPDDFGDNAVDVNYLNVANAASAERIFIC
ncbi:uncharacterized protein C2845_PM04G33560 [Panicum miliaceum]|uniref:Uncharacterized protein n=1 Tax=Panicum miliaceum TaxID=4540 RepID=A0A3L6QKM3_PANMI|nr:uncharacterized protein C2845_PM04G33560 [Panicum miliaceum]